MVQAAAEEHGDHTHAYRCLPLLELGLAWRTPRRDEGLSKEEYREKIFHVVCKDNSDIMRRVFNPYLTYVLDRLQVHNMVWGPEPPSSVDFFVLLVEFFSMFPTKTLNDFMKEKQSEINRILRNDAATPPIIPDQQDTIRAAMICFSIWTMIERLLFILPEGDVRDTPIPDLFKSQNLIPKYTRGGNRNTPAEILQGNLNAHVLVSVCKFDLEWTYDLASHMVLEGKVLKLFAMPCKMREATNSDNDPQRALETIGIPTDYYNEIRRSYGLLFSTSKARRYIRRIRGDIADVDGIEQLAEENDCDAWTPNDFRDHLWNRIAFIGKRAMKRGPDSFWKVLFRDRRNTTAYWGFMVAFLALALTLIQTITSMIQTVKGFM